MTILSLKFDLPILQLPFLFSGLLPARYILAVLGCISMAIIYGLKVNLSVAMVAMLNHSALAAMSTAHGGGHDAAADPNVEEACKATGNSTEAIEV